MAESETSGNGSLSTRYTISAISLPHRRKYSYCLGKTLCYEKYCHVSGVPWRIITGSELDDWIYWHFYNKYSQLQSFVTEYNRWLPKTLSTSSWTTKHLLFHCDCKWRLSYECFLLTTPVQWIILVYRWLPNCSTPGQSQSHVTTDDQSASLSWNKAPIWGLRPDFYSCQTIAGLTLGAHILHVILRYLFTNQIHPPPTHTHTLTWSCYKITGLIFFADSLWPWQQRHGWHISLFPSLPSTLPLPRP
jgi:hypothetical protein